MKPSVCMGGECICVLVCGNRHMKVHLLLSTQPPLLLRGWGYSISYSVLYCSPLRSCGSLCPLFLSYW